MHAQDLAIVRGLIPVAWADGVFEVREQEMVAALLDAYGASDPEKAAVMAYAKEKRTVDDIDVQELSAGDRRILFQHAVLLSYADGEQGPEEVDLLGQLAKKLRISDLEARSLMVAGAERAKRLLPLATTA